MITITAKQLFKKIESDYKEYFNTWSYDGYYYMPVEGQYDDKGNLVYGTDKEYEYLKDNLYVSNIDNYVIKTPSFTSYNGVSYFGIGKYDYLHTLYGNTFYKPATFMRASDLRVLTYEPYNTTYLKQFCIEQANTGFDFAKITYAGTLSYQLWKMCQHTQETIADLLNAYLDTLSIYEFNPVLQNNGQIYTANVFTKRKDNVGKFYGDNIAYKFKKNFGNKPMNKEVKIKK